MTTADQGSGERPKILIVDDEPGTLGTLGSYLSVEYETLTAHNAEVALELLNQHQPDLILLDVWMPGIDGLELQRRLRQDGRTRRVPIILVSAFGETPDIVQGLHEGANDYVAKPINLAILEARIKTHLKVARLVKRLEEANERLAELATYDDLTGVLNRRTILANLDAEFQRSRRYDRALSFFMMDLDDFKSVNDTYGHAAGDSVLNGIVECLRSSLRTTDVLGRYGGEEFCVILPETTILRAVQVAERVRDSVEHSSFNLDGQSIFLTLSIGVSTLRNPMHTKADDLIKEADSALYEAKRSGKNRVVIYKK